MWNEKLQSGRSRSAISPRSSTLANLREVPQVVDHAGNPWTARLGPVLQRTGYMKDANLVALTRARCGSVPRVANMLANPELCGLLLARSAACDLTRLTVPHVAGPCVDPHVKIPSDVSRGAGSPQRIPGQ